MFNSFCLKFIFVKVLKNKYSRKFSSYSNAVSRNAIVRLGRGGENSNTLKTRTLLESKR